MRFRACSPASENRFRDQVSRINKLYITFAGPRLADEWIDKRLAAMAVEGKIDQLNIVAAGIAVTGPLLASGAAECIRARRIGNLLDLWGV